MSDPAHDEATLSGAEVGGARRFAFQLLGTSLVIVLACGLINALVDPYGLFRWVDRRGFNEIKPRANQVGEAFKYRAIDFQAPQTLLLGNSRVEMGWDPDLLSSVHFGKTLNAALPGRGLQAMATLADHAWNRSRPKTLFIGVEFFDCLESAYAPVSRHRKPSPWFNDPTLSRPSLEKLSALISEALSLDATADSIRTLLAQYNPNSAHLRRDGFQTAREYPQVQAIEGPRKLFLQRDQENARSRVNGPKTLRYGNGQLSECFGAVDQLLGDAQARGQNVYLATYPYHARLLELIHSAGLWPAYEQWKLQLVDIVDAWQRAGLHVSLRDFGGYHVYATESIPGPGQRKPVPAWYWESGHFRSELGSKMLDMMAGKQRPEGLFGTELTAVMLPQHLDSIRASRSAFVAAQPEIAAEMATIVAQACRPAGTKNPARSC